MLDPHDIDAFVAFDIGKEAHYVQALSADGAETFDCAVANDETALVAVIDKASAPGQAVFVVDQPGSDARLILELAHRRDIPVAYVTGLQMRRAADLYEGPAKTDRRDAFVLADYARRNVDRLAWLSINDEILEELRILNGRDVDLAADSTRIINRMRDALVAISPALERAIGPHLGDAGVRDLLCRSTTPTALRRYGKRRVESAIAKRSPRLAAEMTAKIWDALEAQSITLPAETAWGEIIRDMAVDLNRIKEQRDALEKQIEAVFHQHPLAVVLESLSGFGPRTGSRTLAEIGDPHRFATGAQLASYAALTPINWQSGKA